MADDPNDPIDITDILELKKINEELRKAGIRPATTQEHGDAKARAEAIEFADPKSKGELVPFGQEQPPERGGIWPLIRKLGRKLHPALGLADLAVSQQPSEEEMQERIKKAGELPKLREDPMGDLKSGLETAIDFITPSKTYKRKLSPTEIEFFEDVTAEGDNYDLLADAPSAKISIDSKGKKFLEVAEEDMDSFMNWIGNEYTLNMGYKDMPTHIRTGSKWHLTFKDEEGKNYWEKNSIQDKGLSGIKDIGEERISIFPKPERMFPEDSRPAGGEYLNPKTGDILTDSNLQSGTISITPEGKPSFKTSSKIVEEVGSPLVKGATQIKTNLFRKSAGWKWKDGPKEYLNIPTLVSVENKGKHYYTLEADFPKGINLTRYSKSKTEPRLRPTIKGFIDLGNQIGTILVRGKEHPVYDKISNFKSGGVIRNPYSYAPRDI